MKKRGLMVLSLICAGCIGVGVTAANLIHKIKAELREDFTIVIDGEKKNFKNVDGEDVYPILYEGTTYLPVRAIGEIMGKTVYWYEDEKKVELKDVKSTVTDADVIISGEQNQDNTNKKPENRDKKDKYSNEAVVTEEEAKQIALQKAEIAEADVKFTKVKLEKDDGILQYEINFKKDKVKYSADISAIDGTVISWDIDDNTKWSVSEDSEGNDIGIEKAKAIVLKKAGLNADDVVFTELSTDYDKGVKVYEIEFRKDRIEYSAEVATSNGEILSWEVDND